MLIDSTKTSATPVQKPEEKPAPPPPPPPAKPAPAPANAADKSSFEAQPQIRVSQPGMDQFTPADVAADPKAEPSLLDRAVDFGKDLLGKLTGAADPTTTGEAGVKPGDSEKKVSPSQDPANAEVTQGMNKETRDAYDALNDEDRAQYNELHTQAAATGNKDAVKNTEKLLQDGKFDEYQDVVAAAGAEQKGRAQTLLFNGSLTNADRDGNTMLDALGPLTQGGTTSTGVDRTELLNTCIDDVSDATNASDQPDGDRHCGPLAVLGDWARQSPGSYANAVVTLAEKGELNVTDPETGENIKLEYKGPPGETGEGKLTLSQQIFVKTFGDYVDRMDRTGLANIPFFGGAIDGFDGMNAREVAEMKELAFGTNYEATTVPDETEQPDAAARAKAQEDAKRLIDEQVANGEKPQVLIDGHWVTVTGHVELDLPFGGHIEYYTYDKGDGKNEIAGGDYFQNNADAVVYNADVSHPPAGSYNPDWDDNGIGNNGSVGGDPGDP